MLLRILLTGSLLTAAGLAQAACLNSLSREAPDERYQLQGETVLDQHTGLVWLRCPLGQYWLAEKSRCQLDLDRQRLFSWQDALAAANNFEGGGSADWRLPNKNELNSLVERACTGPAVNETAFPDTTLGGFWSSTPARHSPGFAWQIDFTTGTLVAFDTSTALAVRLVRSH